MGALCKCCYITLFSTLLKTLMNARLLLTSTTAILKPIAQTLMGHLHAAVKTDTMEMEEIVQVRLNMKEH